jgi:hypothetical protein
MINSAIWVPVEFVGLPEVFAREGPMPTTERTKAKLVAEARKNDRRGRLRRLSKLALIQLPLRRFKFNQDQTAENPAIALKFPRFRQDSPGCCHQMPNL